MKKIVPHLLALAALALSCNSNQSSDLMLNDSPSLARKPLVIVAGGFNSCANEGLKDNLMRAGKTEEMYDLFMKSEARDSLKKRYHEAPAIFSICFSGINSLAESFSYSIVSRYAWNTGKLGADDFGVQSIGIPQGSEFNDTDFMSHYKSEIDEYINDMKNQGHRVDIFFVSHSYGAFTSINLAAYYSGYLKGIVTVDAISMLRCQAQELSIRLDKTLRGKIPGCISAPDDKFSKLAFEKLAKLNQSHAGQFWWFNAYQTSFKWLHSGPIDQYRHLPIINEEIPYSSFHSIFTTGDYHSQSARHPSVWDKLGDLF